MQTNSKPVISVIVPTYDYGRFIGDSIRSVLEQTYTSYEIIVIDDGSSDETTSVLQQFDGRIRYVYQENRGPSAARNLGIKIARGEYISFLDADDLWTPNKLELQLSDINSHPDIGMVFSDCQTFTAETIVKTSFLAGKSIDMNMISQKPISQAFMKLLLDNFITTSSVMVRKECFEKIGLFNESLRSVEDRDLWLRISASFGITGIPFILCRKRLHECNISRDNEVAIYCRLQVLENNRRLFSVMAPASLWNQVLADAYLRMAFSQFNRNQTRATLGTGVKSLGHATMQKLRNGSSSSYPWIKAVGLLPAALFGPKLLGSLRPRKTVVSDKGYLAMKSP